MRHKLAIIEIFRFIARLKSQNVSVKNITKTNSKQVDGDDFSELGDDDSDTGVGGGGGIIGVIGSLSGVSNNIAKASISKLSYSDCRSRAGRTLAH